MLFVLHTPDPRVIPLFPVRKGSNLPAIKRSSDRSKTSLPLCKVGCMKAEDSSTTTSRSSTTLEVTRESNGNDRLIAKGETAKSSPYVPYIIVAMAFFLAVVYLLDEFAGSLKVHDTSASCYKSWFIITNAIVMVILAGTTTYVNVTIGHSIGENLLRKYKIGDKLDVKDSVKTMLESTGLVNALIFASAVAMCTNGAPTDGCGFLDHMYYNFAFNALGASFYGIICAVAPLMYLPVLNEEEFLEYIQDRNNLRGLGASVVTTVASGIETITACVLSGWATYGRTMGVSLWVGVALLFVGTVNKFYYQSVWRAKPKKSHH